MGAKGWGMSTYEDQYYIVNNQYDDNTLYLSALDKTEARDYDFSKLEMGGEPLFFENSYKDEDMRDGKVRPIKKAHMNFTYLVVDDDVKNEITKFDIAGIQLYPAVIIGDDGVYYENYWFFNIYKEFDFLDCEKSEIRNYKVNSHRNKVIKYQLNSDTLDKILEDNRLIFMMPNTDQRTTYVHQKIVDIFSELNVDNIKFHKLSEWFRGKQFRS
jgi:hypothetical protein